MMAYTLIINRATGSFATSFDVWAKEGAFPQNDGDGVFIANVTIDADETSVSYVPTIDDPDSYKYIAIPRYLDQVGLPGQIEAV
jgi:hypothetical protein